MANNKTMHFKYAADSKQITKFLIIPIALPQISTLTQRLNAIAFTSSFKVFAKDCFKNRLLAPSGSLLYRGQLK